jgi:hypothetical protein
VGRSLLEPEKDGRFMRLLLELEDLVASIDLRAAGQ